MSYEIFNASVDVVSNGFSAVARVDSGWVEMLFSIHGIDSRREKLDIIDKLNILKDLLNSSLQESAEKQKK